MRAALAAASRTGLAQGATAPALPRSLAAPRLALRTTARASGVSTALRAASSHAALPSSLPCLAAGGLPALGRYAAWSYPTSRRSFAFGASRKTLYEVLGVPPTATQQEIKRAYLQEAKKCHPDLNPSADATKRFQSLAEAFNVLGKPDSRAQYDAGPSPFEQQQQQQAYSGSGARRTGSATPPPPSPSGPVDADALFRTVLEELGADQLIGYVKGVQDDATEAAQKAKEGDYQPTKDFMWKHKGFAAMVLLPLVAILRFPGLVALALRALSMGGLLAFQAIARDPRLQQMLGKLAWHKWRIIRARAAARSREKAKQ